jgi:ubiquinone/menaquinone biosynthesis C-methylase UbiE
MRMNRFELLDLMDRLSTAPRLAKAFYRGLRQRFKSPNMAPGSGAPVDLSGLASPENFPLYYQENFHGQPNGYLSEESARIYDLGQSFFFLGTDGLVRKTLLRKLPEKATKILDLGCASGGSTFPLAKKYPNAEIHAVDLSPFFIARAKERARTLRLDNQITFHEANVEQLYFLSAGSFDLITSTFLHHEVPYHANHNILREAHRLLQPGGTLAILDELQECDTPNAKIIPAIAHEPHYNDYFKLNWQQELSDAGFSSNQIFVSWLSKTIIAKQ